MADPQAALERLIQGDEEHFAQALEVLAGLADPERYAALLPPPPALDARRAWQPGSDRPLPAHRLFPLLAGVRAGPWHRWRQELMRLRLGQRGPWRGPPPGLSRFPQLFSLSMRVRGFQRWPDAPLLALAQLAIFGTGAALPVELDFTRLPALLRLTLTGACPVGLPDLPGLEWLILDRCRLTELKPGWLGPRLRLLSVCDNALTHLPDADCWPGMKVLRLRRNPLEDLTPLAACRELTELSLDDVPLPAGLPPWVRRNPRLTLLKLSGCGVRDVRDLAQLPLDHLSLVGNPGLDPAPLASIRTLRLLSISRCGLTRLGGLPPHLETFIATHNALQEVPSLQQARRLKWLDLRNNHIERLPEAAPEWPLLETLELRHNRLSSVPRWLFQLPGLSSLTLQGNPLRRLPELNRISPSLRWVRTPEGADRGRLDALLAANAASSS